MQTEVIAIIVTMIITATITMIVMTTIVIPAGMCISTTRHLPITGRTTRSRSSTATILRSQPRCTSFPRK